MKMRFSGTFETLREWLFAIGIVGCWQCEPNGVYMLRRNDGSNLHWASGSKSLWFDGSPEPAAQLRTHIEISLFGPRQGDVTIEHSPLARIADLRRRDAEARVDFD